MKLFLGQEFDGTMHPIRMTSDSLLLKVQCTICASSLTRSTGPHHHAERDLLLEHRLDEHHVQVADDGPVDHHDLVTLDDPCRERERERETEKRA